MSYMSKQVKANDSYDSSKRARVRVKPMKTKLKLFNDFRFIVKGKQKVCQQLIVPYLYNKTKTTSSPKVK